MKGKAGWAVIVLFLVAWTGLGYYWAIGSAVTLHQAHEHRERLTRVGVRIDALVYQRRSSRKVSFRFYYSVAGVAYRGSTVCDTNDGCPKPETLAIRYDPARPEAYLVESTRSTDLSVSRFAHWQNIPFGLFFGSAPLYYYVAVTFERPAWTRRRAR